MDKNNIYIGLDIGANSIKAVALESSKTGYVLASARERHLDTASTENGSVADYGELVHGVKEVMEGAAFSGRIVSTALKGPSTFVKKISVRCEGAAELREQFHWIADQYVSADPEETSLDFDILGEGERYGHLNVLLTGASKDTVTDFVSVLESSKVTPLVIEPEALSLARLYRIAYGNSQGTCALIHVGYVGSLFVVLENGKFSFCCEISAGGKLCTDLIVSELGLSSGEAEAVKITPESHSEPDKVREIIKERFCPAFIKDVEKSMSTYIIKGGEEPFKIVLSGGACETWGLEEALTRKYQIPVEYLDPWKIVAVPDEMKRKLSSSGKYSFNVAVGLAMSDKVY